MSLLTFLFTRQRDILNVDLDIACSILPTIKIVYVWNSVPSAGEVMWRCLVRFFNTFVYEFMWTSEICWSIPGDIRQLSAIPHGAVYYHLIAPTFTWKKNKISAFWWNIDEISLLIISRSALDELLGWYVN